MMTFFASFVTHASQTEENIAIVNDEYVPIDYKLKSKDRVKIIVDVLSYGPREDWMEIAQTTRAKRKIKDFQ